MLLSVADVKKNILAKLGTNLIKMSSDSSETRSEKYFEINLIKNKIVTYFEAILFIR